MKRDGSLSSCSETVILPKLSVRIGLSSEKQAASSLVGVLGFAAPNFDNGALESAAVRKGHRPGVRFAVIVEQVEADGGFLFGHATAQERDARDSWGDCAQQSALGEGSHGFGGVCSWVLSALSHHVGLE